MGGNATNVDINKETSISDDRDVMALKIDAIDECNRSVGPLPTIPNYDWASHEIGEFLSCFHKMIGIAVVK